MTIRHFAIISALALFTGMMAIPNGNRRGKGQKSFFSDTTITTVTPNTDEVKIPDGSVIDEVVWVVGDEPILRSDIEMTRMQGMAEGVNWGRNPDCAIPEQIAVQKLFLHQASIDSIEVTENEISRGIDQQINRWIEVAGGREKLEEYRKKTINEMRAELHDDFKNQLLIQQMKNKIVEHVKVSPADVRAYFRSLPQDSVPFVPMEVEVQLLVRLPRVK